MDVEVLDIPAPDVDEPSNPPGEPCRFCGHPLPREIPEGGHYKMACCNQVISGCCDGTS